MLFAIIFIAYIKTATCVDNTPGMPVPHAEILDDILTRQLGPAYTKDAIFDFILGVSNETKDNSLNETNDNLSIKVLDVENVKKVVGLAKKLYRDTPMRRATNDLYAKNPYVVQKARQFMLHTIYLARERINDTFAFRQKYHDNNSYLIAILYGASTAIVSKMEALLAQQRKFTFRTHFIWYLVIYEKILACNVDINNNVERIFFIHDTYAKARGPKSHNSMFKSRHGKKQRGTTLPAHIAAQLEQQKQEENAAPK